MRRFILGALCAVAAYYAVFGGEYSALELRAIGEEVESARASLLELEEETQRLGTRTAALENDARAIERLAREDFGLIRDGEILYRFADPASR